MVLSEDVETTVLKCKVRQFNSSKCDDLGCMSRSFIDCKLFSILTSVLRSPSAIAELLVDFGGPIHISGIAEASAVKFCIGRLYQVLPKRMTNHFQKGGGFVHVTNFCMDL